MKYYAIVEFPSKEAAEKFAYEQKHVQVEIKDQDDFTCGHMFKDVELVMREYMGLTNEQIENVDVGLVVESLFDYDYSNYNDYIEEKVNEQLAVGIK